MPKIKLLNPAMQIADKMAHELGKRQEARHKLMARHGKRACGCIVNSVSSDFMSADLTPCDKHRTAMYSQNIQEVTTAINEAFCGPMANDETA